MNRREQILTAAGEILFYEGINNITMSKVAAKADVGKSTLYEYFDSKDDMISQTIWFTSNKYVDELYNNIILVKDTFENKLKNTISMFISAIESGAGGFALLFEQAKQTPQEYHCKYIEDMKDIQGKAMYYAKKLIEDGVKQGVLVKEYKQIDFLIFLRMLVVLCISFTSKDKVASDLISDIDNKVDYIYDNIMKILN